MEIQIAQPADAEALADLFLSHIAAHTEYISHGEFQMGVGEGVIKDGELVARPSAQSRVKWLSYIRHHMSDDSLAQVWKAVGEDGGIVGFCVADIEEDGDTPFGMVCDVLVKEDYRGHGTGDALLQTAIGWLRSRGIRDIYLESGRANHAAHRFFEKRGFTHISEIYKLA